MARGNQRDKAREANQKKLASQVSPHRVPLSKPNLPVAFAASLPWADPQTLNRPVGRSLRGPSSALPGGCHRLCRRRENKTGPCTALLTSYPRCPATQKSKNTKTGSEMQRDKEQVAAMMREKQKAGKGPLPSGLSQGTTVRCDGVV